VRELEGALNKVVATALLEGGQWDITRLQRLLGTAVGRASISAETIIDLVSKYFHIKVPDLKGPGRSKDLSYARQIAVYLVRNTLDLSLPKLGDLFGGRNHTSIMYALEKVREDREHNAILDQQIKDIQARLQQLR
jgi:chromosomal replication initiator protein